MVLSWSRHLYDELVFDQRGETWLLRHRHALESFGGVPERVVLDNLKAAILQTEGRAGWRCGPSRHEGEAIGQGGAAAIEVA